MTTWFKPLSYDGFHWLQLSWVIPWGRNHNDQGRRDVLQNYVDPNMAADAHVYFIILTMGEIDGAAIDVNNLDMCGMTTKTNLLNNIAANAENHL